MKKLESKVQSKWVDCPISELYREVWDDIYSNLYDEEFPKSDKEWFELFNTSFDSDYYDEFEVSQEEIYQHKDEIIQYGKDYINSKDRDNFNTAVTNIISYIDEYDFDDCYIVNPNLRDEVKRKAITRLYNTYCKNE